MLLVFLTFSTTLYSLEFPFIIQLGGLENINPALIVKVLLRINDFLPKEQEDKLMIIDEMSLLMGQLNTNPLLLPQIRLRQKGSAHSRMPRLFSSIKEGGTKQPM